MSLQTVVYVLILSTTVCLSQNILNISCCSGNDHPDHSCPPSNQQLSLDNVLEKFQKLPPDSVLQLTNGTCNLTHPLIFTGVSNITIRGQGSLCTHISCNHMNAGLVFKESFDIKLHDFTINSCGVTDSEEKDSRGNASKSIIILNTVGMELQRLVIMNSHGYGLSIENSFGNALLQTLKFLNNRLALTRDELAYSYGGGGLAVVFGMTQTASNLTNYNIRNCTFYNNSAGGFKRNHETVNRYYDDKNTKISGGINLHFHNNSNNIRVTINSCNFTHNNGTAGGGLYVHVAEDSSNCNVNVSESEFFGNNAELHGGGGAYVYFTSTNQNLTTHNSVLFCSVLFENNVGYLGGGAKIITDIDSDIVDHIMFDNCHFTNNSANGGAAVYINTNFVLRSRANQVAFSSVNFSANYLNLTNYTKNAVVLTCEVKVTFAGGIIFINNQATALYSASALLVFKQNSHVKFSNNSGDRGGAILLTGESYMQLGSNIHLEFFNNSASYGGAIYVLPTQVHEFKFFDKCFLYSDSPNGKFKNVSFTFDRNTAATGIGSNIFATSLHPCLELCQYQKQNETLTLPEIFTEDCIGNFSFTQGIFNHSICTSPQAINCSSSVYPIPGFHLDLDISQIDELGNSVGDMFVLMAKIESTTYVATNHPVIQNSIQIYGVPEDTGAIYIENVAPIVRKKKVSFTLANCPPGLTVQNNTCRCSYDDVNHRYYGITDCQQNAAWITLEHWVGYICGKESEDTLYTSECLPEFCTYKNQRLQNGQYFLTNTSTSKKELESLVCGDSRQGILCSTCSEGFTLLYHSPNYECRNKSLVNCSHGIPLYIVSELLPVTLLFLVILIFNINFTSGALSSFVFYAQVIDLQDADMVGSRYMYITFKVFKTFYDSFNLNMLNIKFLSFCLISDANQMQLFMFQYGTVVYSMLLVMVTVLVLRLHSCYYCVKLGNRCGKRNIRRSIVDGLSAFLVLCYFLCTRITFRILNSATIRGKNETFLRNVPWFLGDVEYFGTTHLPYAIPAIFCLIVVIIPPPCILVLEPVFTKLFNLPIWGANLTNVYTKVRMKFMPFLDSFQSSFKSKYRFFAGLYFVYRIAVSASFFSPTIFSGLVAVEIVIFIIILIHAMLQPHKEHWHNILEVALFLDLLFINTISLLTYASHAWGDDDTESEVQPLVWLQLIAMCIPIVFLVAYTSVSAYQNLKSRNFSNRSLNSQSYKSLTDPQDSMGFPARLLD